MTTGAGLFLSLTISASLARCMRNWSLGMEPVMSVACHGLSPPPHAANHAQSASAPSLASPNLMTNRIAQPGAKRESVTNRLWLAQARGAIVAPHDGRLASLARLRAALDGRRRGLRAVPVLSRRPAVLDAVGVLVAHFPCDLSGARLVRAGALQGRRAAGRVAHRLLRARRGDGLRGAADPYRLLRPAHVLRASRGAFRPPSSGCVPDRARRRRACDPRGDAVLPRARAGREAGARRDEFHAAPRRCAGAVRGAALFLADP